MARCDSEEELSDSEWISTDDGEEDWEETSSCDSSSEEEMEDQPCSSASANYFVSKAETWQTTPFANNAGRAAAHNVIQQSPGPTRFAKSQCSEVSDTFTLFLRSSLRKIICQWTNHEGAIVHGSSWKPMDDEEFKVFLGVIILIGVYKSKNESVAQLWSTLDGRPIFNRTMSR